MDDAATIDSEPACWVTPGNQWNSLPSMSATARRTTAMRDWITRQSEIEAQLVTLPESGRRYRMWLPTDAARDALFERARQEPNEPSPWWSRFWPSGVALADALLRQPEIVAGRRVLELGCGLGVTASAAIEAGARLTVSDYAALSLAFCRLNTLANTGQSPRTLRVNWRRPAPGVIERAESGHGFDVILAADVLYESKDIAPLLVLIDRLLAPEGVLWLAEPGRRTAQRFLNTVAADGWHGESTTSSGPWPDGEHNPVGVHLLQRPADLSALSDSLAGWRM